jgi:cytochrome c-type biogenesis protein CcmE
VTPRKRRFAFILAAITSLGVALALILSAFESNLVFFFTPTDVIEGKAPGNTTFRIGGMVETGSVKREDDGLTVHFVVTDFAKRVNVTYTGILPDLFSEGQGVVAEGKIDASYQFTASRVLAKHDENYMAPEAIEALKRSGKTHTGAMSSLVEE